MRQLARFREFWKSLDGRGELVLLVPYRPVYYAVCNLGFAKPLQANSLGRFVRYGQVLGLWRLAEVRSSVWMDRGRRRETLLYALTFSLLTQTLIDKNWSKMVPGVHRSGDDFGIGLKLSLVSAYQG